MTLRSNDSARNPLAELLADALEIAASRPGVLKAIREAFAPSEPSGLQARSSAARALGIGLATLDRRVLEGMPSIGVGRARRFDVEVCKVWLASRKPPATPVDASVAAIARRAGLRVAGGGR